MNAIVNVDENWGIGCGGKLLFPIPEDMRFFRETTAGKVVVMGRKTLLSLPGAAPLKNRVNVVLTRAGAAAKEGVVTANGLGGLRQVLAAYPTDHVYVIGGAAVYRLLLPYCAAALVTRVQAVGHADAHFPNLGALPSWQLTHQSGPRQHLGVRYTFCTYQNQSVQTL